MKSLNEIGFMAAKDPVIVEWLEATRKTRSVNISAEISESIIRLLNSKALSVSQVAFNLRISHEKARRHLFHLWRNGYILRSKYPKERELVYMVGSNPVTMLFWTYTVNDGSDRLPFITFEEWVNLKREEKI